MSTGILFFVIFRIDRQRVCWRCNQRLTLFAAFCTFITRRHFWYWPPVAIGFKILEILLLLWADLFSSDKQRATDVQIAVDVDAQFVSLAALAFVRNVEARGGFAAGVHHTLVRDDRDTRVCASVVWRHQVNGTTTRGRRSTRMAKIKSCQRRLVSYSTTTTPARSGLCPLTTTSGAETDTFPMLTTSTGTICALVRTAAGTHESHRFGGAQRHAGDTRWIGTRAASKAAAGHFQHGDVAVVHGGRRRICGRRRGGVDPDVKERVDHEATGVARQMHTTLLNHMSGFVTMKISFSSTHVV